MVVDRQHQVAGSSVLIRAALPDPARSARFGFFQGFRDGGAMCLDQPMIASQNGEYRNRFRGRDREIVKAPPLCKLAPVRGRAVRAVADSQKLTGARIETLP